MSESRALRLLTLTNTYPPRAKGGYGEICGDVTEELAARGHTVTVLTERVEGAVDDLPALGPGSAPLVRRELDLLLSPWRRPVRALSVAGTSERSVRRVLAEGVDAALVWHMRGVPKPCLRVLHDAGVPVFYMLHDRWVLYERAGAFTVPLYRLDRVGLTALRNALARPFARWRELRAPPIAGEGIVCFVSEWLRREHARLGWQAADATVVTAGVRPDRWHPRRSGSHRPVRRLLYAGRLHPTKGLHTVVEALAASAAPLSLTVVGHEDDPAYVRTTRQRAEELGVAGHVAWQGEVARDAMPALLHEHDVLVYPSVAVESGWLGVLEGLAAGALVVTSAPGAPRELVRDGDNALVFAPGDAGELARALGRLVDDAELRARLRDGARASAEEHSLEAMVSKIESLLLARRREVGA